MTKITDVSSKTTINNEVIVDTVEDVLNKNRESVISYFNKSKDKNEKLKGAIIMYSLLYCDKLYKSMAIISKLIELNKENDEDDFVERDYTEIIDMLLSSINNTQMILDTHETSCYENISKGLTTSEKIDTVKKLLLSQPDSKNWSEEINFIFNNKSCPGVRISLYRYYALIMNSDIDTSFCDDDIDIGKYEKTNFKIKFENNVYTLDSTKPQLKVESEDEEDKSDDEEEEDDVKVEKVSVNIQPVSLKDKFSQLNKKSEDKKSEDEKKVNAESSDENEDVKTEDFTSSVKSSLADKNNSLTKSKIKSKISNSVTAEGKVSSSKGSCEYIKCIAKNIDFKPSTIKKTKSSGKSAEKPVRNEGESDLEFYGRLTFDEEKKYRWDDYKKEINERTNQKIEKMNSTFDKLVKSYREKREDVDGVKPKVNLDALYEKAKQNFVVKDISIMDSDQIDRVNLSLYVKAGTTNKPTFVLKDGRVCIYIKNSSDNIPLLQENMRDLKRLLEIPYVDFETYLMYGIPMYDHPKVGKYVKVDEKDNENKNDKSEDNDDSEDEENNKFNKIYKRVPDKNAPKCLQFKKDEVANDVCMLIVYNVKPEEITPLALPSANALKGEDKKCSDDQLKPEKLAYKNHKIDFDEDFLNSNLDIDTFSSDNEKRAVKYRNYYHYELQELIRYVGVFDKNYLSMVWVKRDTKCEILDYEVILPGFIDNLFYIPSKSDGNDVYQSLSKYSDCHQLISNIHMIRSTSVGNYSLGQEQKRVNDCYKEEIGKIADFVQQLILRNTELLTECKNNKSKTSVIEGFNKCLSEKRTLLINKAASPFVYAIPNIKQQK